MANSVFIGPFNITYTGSGFVFPFPIAIRNGTTPQTFSVYNTYTNDSNYERFDIDWSVSATEATLQTTNAGTGQARNIRLIAANILKFGGGGGATWSVTTAGNILDLGTHSITAGGLIVGPALGLVTAGTTNGAVTSSQKVVKTTTAIANNTATDTVTITVPNAAHSASVRVTLAGSLGAGGAIGANEATGTVSYDIGVARTAGVNAVATISTAYGSGMANVAGAATITVTAGLSAVSGAVGAVNTLTVQVTIAHGSGSSTNHTCVTTAEVINANAAGITVS